MAGLKGQVPPASTKVEKDFLSDKKILADMSKNCASKEAEWAEISKTRSAELVALADTIRLLNDDDALDGLVTFSCFF